LMQAFALASQIAWGGVWAAIDCRDHTAGITA
jgi:hypothetical protein